MIEEHAEEVDEFFKESGGANMKELSEEAIKKKVKETSDFLNANKIEIKPVSYKEAIKQCYKRISEKARRLRR